MELETRLCPCYDDKRDDRKTIYFTLKNAHLLCCLCRCAAHIPKKVCSAACSSAPCIWVIFEHEIICIIFQINDGHSPPYDFLEKICDYTDNGFFMSESGKPKPIAKRKEGKLQRSNSACQYPAIVIFFNKTEVYRGAL